MHPMVLLGDEGLVELCLFCLETVLVSVQDRCTVCTECTTGIEKSFWTHSMGLLGDEAQVEAQFGTFGYSPTLDARLVHGLR
jgi:hypothetical protein